MILPTRRKLGSENQPRVVALAYPRPPAQDAAFASQMEQVLEVYTRPDDTKCPAVRIDEQSKQLISKASKPIAAYRQPARVAYEHVSEDV